jgi:TonB-linked SusC/RagA family outer membrane protein
MAQRGVNFTDRYHLQGKVFADAELLKNLKYQFNLAAVYNSSLNTRFEPTEKFYYPNGDILFENTQNALQNNNNTNYRYIIENLLKYDLTLNDHHFNFLAGQAAQFYRSDYMWAAVKGLPNDLIHELSAGVDEKDVSGEAQEEALYSVFGRVNYNYLEKYLFEANVRADKTSRFPSYNRLGIFPSFSAGWLVSNEPFLQESKILSFLKLRASWGQLGNQEIGYYPYAQVINLGQDYVFGETLVAGAALTSLANDQIRWETTVISNIGLDFNFFRDKLQFVVDVFDKTSKDVLATLPIPNTLGNLGAPFQNIAKVKNRGIEGEIRFTNTYRSLRYFGGVNMSKIKNEIIDIADLETWIYNGGRNINLTGHPIGAYYGLIAEGYFQNDEDITDAPTQFSPLKPGDVKFKDISGPDGVPDGKIDEAYDRTIIGNPFPKLNYAFNLGGSMKGFDIYCFFQGVTGVDRYFWYNNEDAGNYTTAVLDYWREDNPNAAYPRFGNQTNNNKNSTLWVKDASYLRLKNLELGYTLPASAIKSIGIEGARFYVSGNNLITFTKLVDFDPEKILEDERNRVYPQSKVYSLGLTVTF